jgi:hypothetical protein
VDPLFLLMGLLALAYMGSLLAGERRIRGFGLPSGVEYVALGFVLGPSALGLLDRSTLETFDPVAHVALGWITLVIGLGLGVSVRVAGRDTRLATKWKVGSVVSLAALGNAALVAGPIYLALARWSGLPRESRALLAACGGLACAETTRESVRWVTERYRAAGRLSSAVAILAEGDDAILLVALAGSFAVGAPAHLPHMTAPAWALATLLLGAVMGGLAALLIGRELHADETWGTLVGFSVLGTGLVTRLGLSAVSAMFAMGMGLALFSRHRQTLLAMVTPTERTVLHPALLLAGARVDLHPPGVPLGLLVLVALVARLIAKGATGAMWQAASSDARKAGPLLGLGLLSAGTLSMTVGLACALRFPGVVGDSVLALAAASTTLGEIVGPFALRSSLRAAGEIAAPAAIDGDKDLAP